MSGDAQAIFKSLVKEHGQLNTTELAIANKLAALLADDANVPGSTIATLVSLLPKPRAADDGEWRLELLSDSEFETFSKLYDVCSGKRPSKPDKPRRRPLRSDRQLYVEELVLLLDRLEGEQDDARRRDWRNVPAPTDEDIDSVRNALSSLFGLTVMWPRVAAPWIENAIYDVRRKHADEEMAALAAPGPAAGAPVAAAAVSEKRDNVVVLSLGVHSAPRQHVGDAALGWVRPL